MFSRKRLLRLANKGSQYSDWYDRAYVEIGEVCNKEKWDRKEFTNILSLLSPQVRVRRNIRMTLVYFGQNSYFNNLMQSVRISVDNYRKTGIINGQKVSSFALALLGYNESIVLDVWMARALQIEQKRFKKKSIREQSRKIIKSVAKTVGMSPRDCQAAIWSGIIQDYKQTPEQMPVIEEYHNWLEYNRQFPLAGPIKKVA